MTPLLPPHPSLEHLKKEAKAMLKAHKAGDESCCQVLRKLNRFADAGEADILAADVPLKEVQFALAMHYGFKSWDEMKKHVGGELPRSTRDFSKLQLMGDGHELDHFSLAVGAACRLLGKDVDYEKLACLSSNAFAPAVDTGEASTCWWTSMYGRDTCLDLLASTAGFSVRALEPLTDMPPFPDEKAAQEQWLIRQRTSYIPPIREAQAKGEVVLVWREWDGGVPWAWWGIITETRDDGTVLGAALNGRTDNPFRYLGGLYALGNASPSMTDEEADTEMLRRAMRRIRSDRAPYENGQRVRFGLPGMDLLIEQMQAVPYCPECAERAPERVWTCAHSALYPVFGGAKAVAKYLRGQLQQDHGSMLSLMQSVEQRYEKIASLLTPAVTGEGGEHYRDFIGNFDKQKEHADGVLRPIKDEMARAADDIENALAAMGDLR